MLLDDHDDNDDHVDEPADADDTDDWTLDDPVDDLLDGLAPRRLPARTTGTAIEVATVVNRSPIPSAGVLELEAAAHAGSTHHRYSNAWGAFYLWCQVSRGLTSGFEATDVDVREYIHHLITRRNQPVRSVSTIRVALAAITWAFEERDLYSPARHPRVRKTVRGAARLLGTARRQPTPLRLDEMRKIVRGLPTVHPHSVSLQRDQLLIALGWASALRPSNIVALDAEDLSFFGDPDRRVGGLLLHLRRSKTDPYGAGDTVAIPWSRSESACAARLALRHTRTTNRRADYRTGPLFREIYRSARAGQRLHADTVARIIKPVIGELLRIDPAGYSGYSLRRGLASECYDRGVPREAVARHLLHILPGERTALATDRYIATQDPFARPALGEWY